MVLVNNRVRDIRWIKYREEGDLLGAYFTKVTKRMYEKPYALYAYHYAQCADY
jgi:hypothetical protein